MCTSGLKRLLANDIMMINPKSYLNSTNPSLTESETKSPDPDGVWPLYSIIPLLPNILNSSSNDRRVYACSFGSSRKEPPEKAGISTGESENKE
ncbi:hypothetical protein AVEN_150334-1 [Araneus ventricosus]|uniref:Uncharacterized protein n=1 Tax=Araneus ventricosus TaxID=182803 RepID=A0A4Y2V940_ARAVE|nr:hypothetical protein AVEN_150334-1 [Araneus ventricosus]